MKHEGADEHLLPTSFCRMVILSQEHRGRVIKVPKAKTEAMPPAIRNIN